MKAKVNQEEIMLNFGSMIQSYIYMWYREGVTLKIKTNLTIKFQNMLGRQLTIYV